MGLDSNYILLTIDIEEWFQVENFKPWISLLSWSSFPSRVEENTYRLLDMMELPNEDTKPLLTGRCQKLRATFFVLGWVASRFPHLVREIRSRGHEVASHGSHHTVCHKQSLGDFRQDLKESKSILQDIIGAEVLGYRAPSFSITKELLETIQECGYVYDSSYNSFGLHRRYGQLDLCHNRRRGIAVELNKDFYELPISNIRIRNFVFPLGGGFYFRFLPFFFFKRGVRAILDRDAAYLFYLHPWEIDQEQPRLSQASALNRFRHYLHLEKTGPRLEGLLRGFSKSRFVTCREYLAEILAEGGLDFP